MVESRTVSYLNSTGDMFSYDSVEAVRVKAKLLNDDGSYTNSTKFSLDPEITSFEMLQSILAKAFDIKGELSITYSATDDEEKVIQLALLNDWDLDAAILSSSTPYLRLTVQAKPYDDSLGEWDVVAPLDLDIPQTKNGQITRRDTFLDSLTDRLGNFTYGVLGKKGKKEDFKPSKSPMSDSEFRNFLDSIGRLVSPRAFRESVYQGGIEPSLRKVAWRHLLNVFPEELTGKQRFDYLKEKKNEYFKLRQVWKDEIKAGRMTDDIRFVTTMVKKDVIRTDRTHSYFKGKEDNKNILSLFDLLCTYALNHPDVSYCQGMSDMASPLLAVQCDEANAYLCFCALMNRLKYNFMFDGKAMTCKFEHLKLLLQHFDPEFYTYLRRHEVDDLFFTYRWLLLELKREFPFDDALYMLEVMWSTLPFDPPLTEMPLSEGVDSNPSLPQSPKSIGGGTPVSCGTPYTKLLALRRNSSQKTLSSPLAMASAQPAQEQIEDIPSLENSTSSDEQDLSSSPLFADVKSEALGIDRYLSNNKEDNSKQMSNSYSKPSMIDSNLINNDSSNVEYSSQYTNGNAGIPPGENEHENYSKFYLELKFCNNGSPFYVYHDSDDENSSLSNHKKPTQHTSTLAVDSKTRSQCDTSFYSNGGGTVDELQFAFETSGLERKPTLPSQSEFGYGNAFLMFAAVTMILQHRDLIMRNNMDFNDIVLLFDKSVRKNDVHKILHKTRLLYQDYQQQQAQQNDDFDLSVSV